jgi:hypothetical protein
MIIKRLTTKLFIFAALLLLLGPVLVSLVNHQVDGQIQAEWLPKSTENGVTPAETCTPTVDESELDGLVADSDESRNSSRMAVLYVADQTARQLPFEIEPPQLDEEDTQRRIEALALIKNGDIHSPRDFVYAAFIFQHGDCPAHYHFANRLAQIALDVGYDEARWIFAATLDRFLMSIDEFQKFGTQYTWIDGEFVLYPVDPETSDDERRAYNVPSLAEAMDQTPSGSGGEFVQKRRLSTWWLTLIGAGFAALGLLIAVIDPRVNAAPGWTANFVAIVVYIVSAWGHYIQVKSLEPPDNSGYPWNIINGVMVIIWFGFLVLELFHVSRERAEIQVDRIKSNR